MSVWKRNAVVVAIVLFVGAAVYLNWSYGREAAEGGTSGNGSGKLLGQTTLVNGESGEKDDGVDAGVTASQSPDASADPSAAASQLPEGTVSTGYFASARLNRQQARDSALSLLQDAAAREDADEAVKNQLNDNIQTMADYTVTEAQIENLVVAKGYADCVAFIGEDALSLAVSAPEGGLTEADTAKIVDVVKQTAGFTADQIHIIEVE